MNLFVPPDNTLLGPSTFAHLLPFELEKDKWKFVNDINNSDVIPVLMKWSETEIDSDIQYIKPNYNGQLILLISLFHIEETQTDRQHDYILSFWHKLTKNAIIVSTNNISKNSIYYDFLFNRQKVYFTEYDNYHVQDRVWVKYSNKNSFRLSDIDSKDANKKFLAPMRIYGNSPRMKYRELLKNNLRTKNGYLSYEDNTLLPEGLNQDHGPGTWLPVANTYYVDSYVSIYVETITFGQDVKSVTEKTFDPLIKGHYILPFGYSGLINDIKNYGFQLPKWIDYSYDSIVDDVDRFNKFIDTVHHITSLSLTELKTYQNTELNMLRHNRSLFYDKDYDSLYDKILCQKNQTNH